MEKTTNSKERFQQYLNRYIDTVNQSQAMRRAPVALIRVHTGSQSLRDVIRAYDMKKSEKIILDTKKAVDLVSKDLKSNYKCNIMRKENYTIKSNIEVSDEVTGTEGCIPSMIESASVGVASVKSLISRFEAREAGLNISTERSLECTRNIAQLIERFDKYEIGRSAENKAVDRRKLVIPLHLATTLNKVLQTNINQQQGRDVK